MSNKIVIRQYLNNEAKKEVIKNIIPRIDNEYIQQWIEEDHFVKCYFIEEDNIIKSFSILRKCDFDPLNEHSNPYVLNYIHTFPEYRNQKYAYKLLLFLRKKSNEQITAVCNCDASEKLFTKAKYKPWNNKPIYRYP